MMKRFYLWVLVLGLLLAGCGVLDAEVQDLPPEETGQGPSHATETPAPQEDAQPPETAIAPIPVPGWIPEAVTYRDHDAGFALEYPAGWFVIDVAPEIKAQSFAYSTTIQSWDPSRPGSMGIPDGESKVDVSVFKSGVHAPEIALELRGQELANTGQILLNEEQWVLQDGWIAYRLKVEGAFGVSTELVTARQGLTIVLGGLGDFTLLDEIYRTLRQIGPGWQTAALPHPVYFLRSDGQELVAPGLQNVWRVDPDGTLSQLTDETFSVTGFAVSPIDSSVAYSTFGENAIYRIDADSGARSVLFQGADLSSNPGPDKGSQIANLAWSLDGTQIAFGMGGVYVMPAEGGEPALLLANQESPDVELTAQRFYSPLSFSPDGEKLLVWEGTGLEESSYAVINFEGDHVISLGPGNFCCDPRWGPDSSSFTFSNPNFGMLPPGLWRADAASGEVAMLVRGFEGVGFPGGTGKPMQLFSGVRQFDDGVTLGFTASGTYEELYLDEGGNESAPRLRMSRISSDGQDVEVMRAEAYPVAGALWAPNGSGALLTLAGGTLLWLPLNGDPMILTEGANQPQWGQ